jgi:hypothetical protein
MEWFTLADPENLSHLFGKYSLIRRREIESRFGHIFSPLCKGIAFKISPFSTIFAADFKRNKAC